MTFRQVSLTDMFTPTAEKLKWRDLHVDEHREYLGRIRDALEQLEGADAAAADYAREQLTAEAQAVETALAGVVSVEAEREAWRDALVECEEAQRAIDVAKTVKTLVDARAAHELATRKVATAFETFKAAAHASRLPSVSSYPLHAGRVAAIGPIANLNDRIGDLDDCENPHARTISEMSAYDAARGEAQCEKNAVPWIIAGADDHGCRVFRLWFHYAARRHGIKGAETHDHIFKPEAAAAE